VPDVPQAHVAESPARYSHRRTALNLAELAASLAAADEVTQYDIELLAVEVDVLKGWVPRREPVRSLGET
jgi:hypothetical protein